MASFFQVFLFRYFYCVLLITAFDSFFAMVDFATVIPIWLTYFLYPLEITIHEVVNFSTFANYVLHGAYTLRILRALRIHKKLMHIEDEVKRTLFNMLLTVLTMILFGMHFIL
jgi:hypothetical protein